MRRCGVVAIVAAAAIVAAPATASAKTKYKIGFEKDCPELICTGTLIKPSGQAIPGSAVDSTLTVLWAQGNPPLDGVLGYSAVETFSRGSSEFTMNLVGTVDYNAEPDVTHVLGAVVSGSWFGRELTGALVEGSARRVFGTTFRGVLTIRPRR